MAVKACELDDKANEFFVLQSRAFRATMDLAASFSQGAICGAVSAKTMTLRIKSMGSI